MTTVEGRDEQGRAQIPPRSAGRHGGAQDARHGLPVGPGADFRTIAPYTIEEAYEVADAIEKGDRGALKEELGDLLLQVVYHARMAEEEGAFAFADVVDAIAAKMIRRHPHVFGSEAERAAGAAPGFWERIKAEERAAQPASDLPGEGARGGAAGVARTTCRSPCPRSRAPSSCRTKPPGSASTGPRSRRSSTSSRRSSASWRAADREQPADRRAKIGEEFGDLLFVVANVARHLKIDPEAALRSANQKFMRRFRRIEELLAAQGRAPAQSTLAEMDRLWDQAKGEEREAGSDPSP